MKKQNTLLTSLTERLKKTPCILRSMTIVIGLLGALPSARSEVTTTIPPVNLSPKEAYNQLKINYQGVASIARAPGGRLWAVWYAGPNGEDVNNYLLGATSADGGKTWSDIKFLIDPDGDGPLRACNPVFWLDPNGALWLLWCQFPESKTTKSIVWAIVTENPDDENPKWSAPRAIFEGVTQNKPIVNHRGEWLLPVATWYQPESCRVAVSTDNGESWTLRGTATVPNADDRSCDEPNLVELADGSLLMFVRTKYGIGRSTSTDAGRTWSPVENTGLPHTPTRVYLGRLQSGNLLLLKHGPLEGKPVGRKKLTAFISKDDGKTWEGGLLLDERMVSYPDCAQGKDGTIYVIYDRDRYVDREIWFTAMNEEDVLAGKPVSGSFVAPTLVNKAPSSAETPAKGQENAPKR